MPSPETPARQRLFFALWPDDEVRKSVDHFARKTIGKSGKRVPASNLHVTLAFLGPVTPAERSAAESAADAIRARAFELSLDTLGHWARPRIFWLAPSRIPAELAGLARDLAAGLREAGLSLDPRPYRPHVTLARKISHPPATGAVRPIVWPARSFSLVSSVTDPRGARYEVVKNWPLIQEK